jgi:SOS-response transcriptional repressor LexA
MTSSTRPTTTAAPAAVADVVRKFAAARGYAPTIVEIGQELRLDHKSAIRAVDQAEAAGSIERRHGCPRAIRAVDHTPGRRRPS